MINFSDLNNRLAPYLSTIIIDICPGGKFSGREYQAGNITGGSGKSFSFNTETGAWADFATSDRGGDIISLYAKIYNINNGEAARQLTEKYLGKLPVLKQYPIKKKMNTSLIKPPLNTAPPDAFAFNGVLPTKLWCYRDHYGDPLFYVARYDLNDGTKQFCPLSFEASGKWVRKAWPNPRPLYNLDKLHNNVDKPVLIVEGEKAADAAEIITKGLYVVVTWQNGASSIAQADIEPLVNRRILLWPDADHAGSKAMEFLAARLVDVNIEVKYIHTDKQDGWDAHDALTEGWDFKQFKEWATPLITVIPRKQTSPSVEIENYESPDYSQPAAPLVPMLQSYGCEFNSRGQILLNTSNLVKVLQSHSTFKGKIVYDTFYQRMFTTLFNDDGEYTPWKDAHDLKLLFLFQSEFGFSKISKQYVIDAAYTVADLNRVNEPQSYFNSLVWDGQNRIDDFFIRAMGAEESEYTKKVSRNLFIAIAARVLKPGCKFDNMVILEGGQGTFKSTSLSILGGKWFAEAPSNLDNKDFEQALVGNIIVEFDELDQFRRSESTLIKKKLSTRIDHYRPSYGRHVIDVPRTCVFVGTTNSDTYLQDETGARRFWPIKINVCDIEYIKENRDQLFAEAVTLFKQGEEFYSVPDSIREIHLDRYEIPIYVESILSWFNSTSAYRGEVKAIDIWTSALLGDPSKFTNQISATIGKSLKYLGYKRVSKKEHGTVTKVWRRDTSEPIILPEIAQHKLKNYAPIQ